MAKDKKSFVLYSDQRSVVDLLSDEQAGKLLKHIYSYVNDENPTLDDLSLKLAFEPIKLQLKRDLKKWEEQLNQRIKAGKASAEKRKRNSTSVNERSVSSTVNVNDNVTVNDTVNEIKEMYKEHKHLNISLTDFNKLVDVYGRAKSDEYVDKVCNYSKNTKYTSLYLTALAWLRKDYGNNGTKAEVNLPNLTKQVANISLQVPAELERLLKKGYTKDQILKAAGK